MVGASERCARNEGTKYRKVFVRKLFEEANVTRTEQQLLRRGPLTKTYCKQNATLERQVDAGIAPGSDP